MPQISVAGFRLVRKLGAGSRADVFLGHAGVESPRTAAIKVFRPETAVASIDAEVRALSLASHAHTLALRDLSTGEDGRPALVLERLELGNLSHLLTTRSLSAGEAVTILAPLCAAVGAMHESGVAHGRIASSRVLFRESGAPVLCGFGHATFGGDGVEADNRALAALASGVLERVVGGESVRDWLASLVGYPRGFGERLSERVFDLAEPQPVRFAPDPIGTELVPARALGVAAPVVESVETPRAGRLAFLDPYLTRIPDRFRKPRYLAIVVAALTVIIAIAVVPSGEPAAAPVVTASTAPPATPIVDDDPVAAFGLLIETRNQCIRDLSVLCLDAVLQQGSAAMADDLALIRSIEKGDGPEAVLSVSDISLVERIGDAALVGYSTANGEPASALLVKGEAGWRIRSYVPA
jgi:tRNA A-37 threonylcarbamoyl transferase component Bud32